MIECFKATPAEAHAWPRWPSQSTGTVCKLKHSVFTAAKRLSVSDIKVCINSSHMYLTDPIDKVRSFGQLLISVGRVAKYDEGNGSSFVQEDLEWD